MNGLSRRGFLKGLGAVAGAAIGTRLPGGQWLREAKADGTTKSAVVSIFFEGGFNALFSSADSFSNGTFGVTSSNVTNAGNGLVVDAATMGTLGTWALGHMAAIGNRHGATDHPTAMHNNFADGSMNFPVTLAAAMGGDAAFKAAAMGDLPPTGGPSTSANGVSLQLIRSMDDVATALGVGAVDPTRPARTAASAALARARQMSAPALAANPNSLSFAKDAYDTNVDSLAKPPLNVNVGQVTQAYGTSSGGTLDLLPSKLAAAELMLLSGTNVITMTDTGWDSHGDSSGTTVRNHMTSTIMPSLRTFISRLRSDPTLSAMNISVILHGDFARSLPGSDHAPALSALVIGPNVKVGTTGHVTPDVQLPNSPGASKEMWSYLAALAKVGQNPFGANPHDLVL